MRNVLITGVAGFIGANLSRSLIDKGHNIYGLDNLSYGCMEYVPDKVNMRCGSITMDLDSFFRKEELENMDCIIHLAACSGIQNYNNNLIENSKINIIGTIKLLEAAKKYNIPKFIFASSGGTILGAQKPPVHEESSIKPISPYGASKASGEHFVNSFYETFGLKTTIVRFSNVYGPYSFHKKNNLIPAFMMACKNNEEFKVYGDGNQTRDFIHVDDLTEAIYKILINKTEGETFQIATGIETPIVQVIDEMNFIYHKITNNWKDVKKAPKQLGDVEENYALIDKVKNKLNWNPKIFLEDGLEKLFKSIYFK